MSHAFDPPSMTGRGPSFFPAGLDFVVVVGVLPDECNTLFSIADTNPGYEPKAPTNGDRIRPFECRKASFQRSIKESITGMF
jgi:hypothetical protein